MLRHSSRSPVIIALLVLGSALGWGPRPATAAQQPDCPFPVGVHFLARYNSNPFAFGCPTSSDSPYQNGSFQEFANGEMDWSPSQGTEMVISGVRYKDAFGRTGIHIQFGPSDPFSYDSWLTRISFNGGEAFQTECGAGSGSSAGSCTRTTGDLYLTPTPPGHYQTIFEGCDINWVGSHTCRQSWTIPVDVDVFS